MSSVIQLAPDDEHSCRRREQFHRSLLSTPGREAFYLEWIECQIALWKVHLLALISPGRNHITRLISIFRIQTAHCLVLCTNVKHDVRHRLSEYLRK